jgi:hypothetical protein
MNYLFLGANAHLVDLQQGFTVFRAALEKFPHAKARKEHQHARCVCKTVDQGHLRAFQENGFVPQDLIDIRTTHHAAVVAWRTLEIFWQNKSAHNPKGVLALSLDDTKPIGFPHFSQRAYKGLASARVEYIPWMCYDHSTNKHT